MATILPTAPADHSSVSSMSPDQLRETLAVWRRPNGVLSREQVRALIDWDGVSPEELQALKKDLATMEQTAEAKPLAPNQRRGHNSLLDRVRGLFR